MAAEREQYDFIVIGSGMSGMATASLLAQFKKARVLVLESHFTLGGFLHSFKRQGYEWDPGFHYIGEMGDGTPTRRYMDLVTGNRVQWKQLDRSFEQLIFPDATIDVPSTGKEHQAMLKDEFPAEAKGIDQYFKDLKKIRGWGARWFYSKLWPDRIGSIMSKPNHKLASTVTQDYLDRHLTDPLLKAVLTCQWGDYGTPPGRSAFGIHGMVANDFMNGGYYAIGGAQKIADSAAEVVEEHGGQCLTRHPVTEILIENNKAYGVEVETRQGPKQFFAPHIISAAGIDTTFNRLVPDDYAKPERARLSNPDRGISATILFMGIKDDPRRHGFKDTNYWMFDRLNHGYEEPTVEFPPSIGNTTLSFASLRNPDLTKHVAQLVTFSAYRDWEEFRDAPWKKRGDQYEAMKEQYIENLLDFAEERTPGLRDLIEYRELSTPLTVESMSSHVDGQVYGRECTPDRVNERWNVKTSVDNLYLTGTDICLPGVNSALMMGVMTSAKFLGPGGIFRLMLTSTFRKAKYSTVVPTDSPESVPV